MRALRPSWANRIRTGVCRSQSPVPYRLAIAQGKGWVQGFEPWASRATIWEGRCSIRLSYRLMLQKAGDGNRTHVSSLEGWCSTIELHPHMYYAIVIGVTRFELATPCSQSRCSSQTEPHPVILFPKTQMGLYYVKTALSIPFRRNLCPSAQENSVPVR